MSEEIFVKVIRANPLIGPCDGKIQFLVKWVKRHAERVGEIGRGYLRFRYAGKWHKVYDIANPGYGTVYNNFQFIYNSIGHDDVVINGRKYNLTPEISNWSDVVFQDIPDMQTFDVWRGDENGRRNLDTIEHWDIGQAIREQIRTHLSKHEAAQARGFIDGDDTAAYASYGNGKYLSVEIAN